MNTASYPSLFYEKFKNNKNPTVLLFDSGVGGLSIYKEIFYLLPDVNYIYVFDNVAFPYGEQPDHIIFERVTAIIHALSIKYPITLAVIACNTASTLTLPILRKHFTFPIVGVVPAIKPAAMLSHNKIIGLLATPATLRREYTLTLINRYAAQCRIEMLASTELVKWAELKLRGEKVPISEIKEILIPWHNLIHAPDIIVLGCTHFPLLKEELLCAVPKGTQLIDSGAAVAKRTAKLLHKITGVISQNDAFYRHAYCLALTQDVLELLPAFNNYGFSHIHTLTL